MRTVEDASGRRYLLEKASGESWLVRDPESGRRHHLPAADLAVVDGRSPLETAAASVPDDAPVRGTVPGERALGLLAEIRTREPVAVRTLLDATDLCESDLSGLLADFDAAGLVVETRVAGERAYETTDRVDWEA